MELTDSEIVASFGCDYDPDLEPEVWFQQPPTNEPVRRLFCALIADAVEAVTAPLPEGRTEREAGQRARIREARAWFRSPDEDYIFSFRFCCRELGLDPWYILAGINKLGRRKKRRNQYTERKRRIAA